MFADILDRDAGRDLPGDFVDDALAKPLLVPNQHGRGLDQIAFGASGISAVGSTYAQDDRTLRGWRSAVRSSLAVTRA